MAPVTRRGTQPTDVLNFGFIILFAAILLAHAPEVAAWPWLLLADALVIALLALLRLLPEEGTFAELVGGGYPFILATAFYWQLGAWLFFSGKRDAFAARDSSVGSRSTPVF